MARANFRADAGDLEWTAVQPSFSPSPSLLLAGLDAATTYTLSVVLTDPAGNAVTVSGLELTTPPAPDTQAPSISALAVGPVTDTTVRITWQTDELAAARGYRPMPALARRRTTMDERRPVMAGKKVSAVSRRQAGKPEGAGAQACPGRGAKGTVTRLLSVYGRKHSRFLIPRTRSAHNWDPRICEAPVGEW
ncbi:MAG: hypothetical protein GY842_25840 [bacterium]|nr:hypothetical protein [bacterium]